MALPKGRATCLLAPLSGYLAALRCEHASRRPPYAALRADLGGLETRIKEICATRVRCGYRRVHVFLQR